MGQRPGLGLGTQRVVRDQQLQHRPGTCQNTGSLAPPTPTESQSALQQDPW